MCQKDYLPKTDLDPITPATNDPGALNSPLIMGPEGAPESPLSVLELPQITVDEDPGALVLPDLTMPTPENTVAGDNPYRQTLKPQLNDQTGNQFELQPRMQAPQALPYGGSYIPSPTRRLSVPIQVEFFSISRGYIPYGGYRSRGYSGYRPYGGGYGGGRYCPYGR